MHLSRFIEELKNDKDIGKSLVFQRNIPSHEAVFESLPGLHPLISSTLSKLGAENLYSHQAEAVDLLRAGNNVLVATPTASGKSLIYNISFFEEVLRGNGSNRALYIFPLKALAQDQFKALSPWLKASGKYPISADIYDGDTSPSRRKKIRQFVPNILITNPDMLHRGILAYHKGWEELLKNLTLVVLDEVHTYRGIFGSHVNQTILRLKRLCRLYGTHPRFVMLSATVSNPAQFGEALIQEQVKVVDSSGGPMAGRHFLFLNPVGSPNFTAASLFLKCVKAGFRTIAFTQSRKVTELMHVWAERMAPQLKGRISSYRAGFMPEERRIIERNLVSGDLLGVISTSALEMGIDIGLLDVCILVGYPGTVINTWQRSGRVGRAGRESMTILIAKPDALDQYFMHHPEEFFGRPCEAAVIDPANPYVLEAHLPCAAAENPITEEDSLFWPRDLLAHLEQLERKGELARSADDPPAWFATKKNPHLHVDIRSTGDTYTIFDKSTGEAIGTADGMRAFKECHPGAVYLHHAKQFVVEKLLLEEKDILVGRSRCDYFTRALGEKETEILKVQRSRPRAQFLVRMGQLKVTERILSYEKRALPGQELMGVFPLSLPPRSFETVGLWIEIEDNLRRYIEKKELHFMGGIHAVEHAAISLFPLFALCDRNDIGGICFPHHPQVGKGAIFIYDAYPGGIGLAQRGFEVIEELLGKTLALLRSCECENGCPSCIHSPKCGAGNKPLDKRAAMMVLKGLLGEISLEELATASKHDDTDAQAGPESATETESDARRIIFLDIETQRLAQEVGGWRKAHLMRVSVAVVFDSVENDFRVFFEKDTDELMSLLDKADLVIGFNIKGFDYKVLNAYSSKDLSSIPTFDILEDIHRRLGFRITLDHLARETLSQEKLADGIKAVEWFRNKEFEKLIAYCKQDVRVTRDIFRFGVEQGHLIYKDKKTDQRLRLKVDWKLDDMIQPVKPSERK